MRRSCQQQDLLFLILWQERLVDVDLVFPVVKDISMPLEKDVANAVVIEHWDILHGFHYFPLGKRYLDLRIRQSILVPGVIVEIAEIASLKLTKRNAFRGGELLDINLNGNYEWQTGHNISAGGDHIHSYEYGGDISLGRLFDPCYE